MLALHGVSEEVDQFRRNAEKRREAAAYFQEKGKWNQINAYSVTDNECIDKLKIMYVNRENRRNHERKHKTFQENRRRQGKYRQ